MVDAIVMTMVVASAVMLSIAAAAIASTSSPRIPLIGCSLARNARYRMRNPVSSRVPPVDHMACRTGHGMACRLRR